VWDTVTQSIALRGTLWDHAAMPRMEHVTVRLPSDLVDELHREGEAMGCGMSWAMRRRLEAAGKASSHRSRRSERNESHGGGKSRTETERVSS
jgi:hypothetical protein